MKIAVRLILICGLTAQIGARQRPSPPTGSIEGVVLDSVTGRPVAGVSLTLTTDGVPYNSFSGVGQTMGITDAQGRFVLNKLDSGEHRLVTSKSGYAPAKAKGRTTPAPRTNPAGRRDFGSDGLFFTLAPGQSVKDAIITLIPSSVISGRVVDTSGRAVTRGLVSARRFSYDEFGEETLEEVRFANTTDTGEFRIFDLEPGEYYILVTGELPFANFPRSAGAVAHSDVFFPGTADKNRAEIVVVRPGEELLLRETAVPLMKSVPVHVRVVNDTGVPYPKDMYFGFGPKDNVQIPYIMASRAPLDALDPRSWNPREMLATVLPGTNVFFANAVARGGNYVFAETTMEVNAGEEPTVDLILRKAVRFGGRAVLRGSNGVTAPLSGLSVRLALAHPPVPNMLMQSGILDTATGSEGMFSFNISESEYQVIFSGLAEDTYLISAKQNGKDILSGTAQISGESDIEIIAASDGAVLDGLVKNAAGEPMSGAIVALVPESSLRNRGDLYRTATSDQSGKFVLHGIAPGTYKLFAWMDAEGIAPFRNAQFMKKYEELGKEIEFTRSQHATSPIQLADEKP